MKSVVVRVIALVVALVCLTSPSDAFSAARPLTNTRQQTTVTSSVSSPMSFQHSISYSSVSVQRSMASSSEEESSNTKSILDRPGLAALDFGAILLFAFIGTSSHNSASDFLAIFAVAIPFLISWFAVTPFLGLYNQEATSDIKTALTTTAKGWIVAIPLGCVLRGIIKGYVPPLPFVIVTMIATLVVLGGSRVAYTAISEKRSAGDEQSS